MGCVCWVFEGKYSYLEVQLYLHSVIMALLSPVPLTVFHWNWIKIWSAVVWNMVNQSQRNFAHFMTVTLSCHEQVSLWLVQYILKQSTSNFYLISNSIEILLVGWGPGHLTDPESWGTFHQGFFHCISNSMEISLCFRSSYNEVIAMKFCTWHNSCAMCKIW